MALGIIKIRVVGSMLISVISTMVLLVTLLGLLIPCC